MNYDGPNTLEELNLKYYLILMFDGITSRKNALTLLDILYDCDVLL